jgi:hypothetical protein
MNEIQPASPYVQDRTGGNMKSPDGVIINISFRHRHSMIRSFASATRMLEYYIIQKNTSPSRRGIEKP